MSTSLGGAHEERLDLELGGPELGKWWVLALPETATHSGCPLTTLFPFGPSSEKRHLQVNVTNPVQCSLHGKKCTVSVETRLNQPEPDFTKNRSGFILSVPGN